MAVFLCLKSRYFCLMQTIMANCTSRHSFLTSNKITHFTMTKSDSFEVVNDNPCNEKSTDQFTLYTTEKYTKNKLKYRIMTMKYM